MGGSQSLSYSAPVLTEKEPVGETYVYRHPAMITKGPQCYSSENLKTPQDALKIGKEKFAKSKCLGIYLSLI